MKDLSKVDFKLIKNKEIKSARTYNQKVFDIGKGKKRFKIHSGHIHYKDKKGTLQDSDFTIKKMADGSWSMDRHNYHFVCPEYSDGMFDFYNAFEKANHHIKLRPVAGHAKGEAEKEENAIIYKNAFGEGIDYKAVIQRAGVRKIIVINKNPKKDIHFDFELILDKKSSFLKQGLIGSSKKLKVSEKEIDFTGKTFRFGKDKCSYVKQAIIWDSDEKKPKQENIKLSLFKVNGKIYLRKFIPKEFFDGAVFPVFTDHPTSYYGGMADGFCGNEGYTWTTIRGASSGNTVNSNQVREDNAPQAYHWVNTYCIIFRTFFFFDTSAIADGDTVDSCDLKLRGYRYAASSVSAQKGTQADTLTTNDYNNFEGNEYGHVSWAADAWNSISFNAQGKVDINKTGVTKICCREYEHDYLDSMPVAGFNYRNGCYFADHPVNIPYLDITTSSGEVTYPATGRGKNRLYNAFSPLLNRGIFAITLPFVNLIGRGLYDLVVHRYDLATMRGKRKIYNEFLGHEGRGRLL